MGKEVIIYLVVAMVVVLSLYLPTSDAVTMPYLRGEKEHPAIVKVKVKDTESRRKRSDDPYPDHLEIDLSSERIHQKLSHLERNDHVPHIQHVDMWDKGEIKRFKFENNERAAYYIDSTNGAALRVCLKSDNSEEFDIYGTFMSNKVEYIVQPAKNNQSTYTLSEVSEKMPVLSDYVQSALPDADQFPRTQERWQQTSRFDREKRQTTAYEVEIYFVHDLEMYNSWYATTEGESDRNTATINKLTQFTSFLLNAIDLRYQTITEFSFTVSCIYAGIYISNTVEGEPISEYRNANNQIISGDILANFRNWGNTYLENIANYDNAMLFTGYDIGIVDDNGTYTTSVAGYAYLPTYSTDGDLLVPATCGANKYSINEGGDFKPTVATIAAHELGHILGANHDVTTNACSSGFVMNPSLGVSKVPAENLRLWQFSSCSQAEIQTYISKLVSPNFVNCMAVRNATNNDQLDPYVNDLSGQTYSPDVQCERMNGPGSYLSRSFFNGNYSTICSLMPCANPSGTSITYRIPWEGTTCGNGKICQSGHCVESSSAPEVNNETCVFGDVPDNVPGYSSGCSDLLGDRSTSRYCYQDNFRERCCQTCEDIRQANSVYEDCDYGDEANCSTQTLYSCRVNYQVCCQTCQNLKLDIPGCPWGNNYSNCVDLSCSSYAFDCCQNCAPETMTTALTTTPTTTTTTQTTRTTTPTTTTTTPTPITTTPITTTTASTTTTTTPTTTTTTPTTTTTTRTTTTTKPTTTTTTPTTTTTTTTKPTITTTTPTTTTTTPSTTTTPTTTTTTPTTTTTTPTTTTTTAPTTTTTATTTTFTKSTTTTTTPTTTTTTPTITTTTPTITTTMPTTTTPTPTITTRIPTTTTTTPTTTTTTPTTTTTYTTTTPTTTITTTTQTTTTTTPTTTTTTPTTTTPTTTITTPTTTTTTPTTTTTTPTTTTTTLTRATNRPTTTTTSPITPTTSPTTTTTTPTTTTPLPTTTTTSPTTTTTKLTTTTTTPTTTTTTPTSTIITPNTTTTSTTTTTTTTPTTTITTTTPTTTATTPTTTTTTPTTTSSSITTTTTRRPFIRTKILIFIWIFPINVGNTDLNDNSVRQNMQNFIIIYLRRFLGGKIRGIKITSLRLGSLVVDWEAEVDDTPEAAAEVTNANIDLVTGKETITVLNETVSATSCQINNTIVTNETARSSETVCSLFIVINGDCGEDYYCSVDNGSLSCIQKETQYGLEVLIAVSVSVFVFVLAVYVVMCLSIRAYRLRKLKHKTGSRTTGSTDYDDQERPHIRTIAPYGSIGGRQDMTTGYPSYLGEVIEYSNGGYMSDTQHDSHGHSQSQESNGYSGHRDRHNKHNRKHKKRHLRINEL